jgi:hypothetical protein
MSIALSVSKNHGAKIAAILTFAGAVRKQLKVKE